MKYKNFTGGIQDVDIQKRVVTGYLSSFGNKDYDGDVIVKGAFKKTIEERKNQIFFLNQHDWKQPHGKFDVLREDEKGLYFESTPLLDTSYSSDTLKLYDAGIIKEHSIGFTTIKGSYDNDAEAYIMKEVKLYEGSNVTLGANPDTPFTGFKNLTLKEVELEEKKILKAFRNGTFTDETFGLLEVALKTLRQQAVELYKKEQESLKIEIDPFNDNQNHIKSVIDKQKEVLTQFIKSI